MLATQSHTFGAIQEFIALFAHILYMIHISQLELLKDIFEVPDGDVPSVRHFEGDHHQNGQN